MVLKKRIADRCFAEKPIIWLMLIGLVIGMGSCNSDDAFKTRITIEDDKWYINGEVINPGSPAEGLLMNVRMVSTTFEDRGGEIEKFLPDFDPDQNTEIFLEKLPEYVASGVNAFTLCLQGGNPGYEGAINTAFNPDGSLRDEYMQRVERVIRAADDKGAAIILSLFYQRQHSHFSELSGRESIMKAVENSVNWIAGKDFTNVVLEVANEYRHGGFRNWVDGDWFVTEAAQVEMIRFAKDLYPGLLVSTSGMGSGTFHEDLARESDFFLIHFNNTALDDYEERINRLKKYGKPIVCNEDDKVMREGAIGLLLTVLNGAGWGYMNSAVNQYQPFVFKVIEDDPEVYGMYKNVATPGFTIDPESLKHTSITITYPNDGDIFMTDQNFTIRFSHLYPDSSASSVVLLVNDQPAGQVGNRLRYTWNAEEPGIYNFVAVVYDQDGTELYRSANVDIIVE